MEIFLMVPVVSKRRVLEHAHSRRMLPIPARGCRGLNPMRRMSFVLELIPQNGRLLPLQYSGADVL